MCKRLLMGLPQGMIKSPVILKLSPWDWAGLSPMILGVGVITLLGGDPSFLIASFRSLDLGFIAFGCLGAQTLCKSGTQFVKDAISEPFLSSNEFQSTCGHAPLPYIYRAAIFCRDVFISSLTVIHLISIWSLSRIGCCPHCWVGDWGIHPHHQTATSPFEYRFYGLYLQECENTWHFTNSNIN